MPAQMLKIDVGLYRIDELSGYVAEVFKHHCVDEADAQTAAKVLLRADKARIWSHGMNRLPSYDGMFNLGRLNPSPNIHIVQGNKAAQTVDGDNGCGLVVGHWANNHAIELCHEYGVGMVAVKKSNHCGSLREYLLENTRNNLAGSAYTNTTSLVAVMYSQGRFLGTNPISHGFPTSGDPVISDMATTTVAVGKLEVAIELDIKVPSGWVVDKHGKPTKDPNVIKDGGALVGLGSTPNGGGHKGTSLGTVVEFLSFLGGSRYGPFVPPFFPGVPQPPKHLGEGTGHFFTSFNPTTFNPDYFHWADDFVTEYRKLNPADPEGHRVLLTGDSELAAERATKSDGIMIPTKIMDKVKKEVSPDAGIPVPEPTNIIKQYELEF